MKTKCVTNRSGYEHFLTVGEKYKVLDIQDGIFGGDYYVTVEIPNSTKPGRATALLHRFDITKEQAEAYVVKHHSDWRENVND